MPGSTTITTNSGKINRWPKFLSTHGIISKAWDPENPQLDQMGHYWRASTWKWLRQPRNEGVKFHHEAVWSVEREKGSADLPSLTAVLDRCKTTYVVRASIRLETDVVCMYCVLRCIQPFPGLTPCDDADHKQELRRWERRRQLVFLRPHHHVKGARRAARTFVLIG